MERPPSPVMVEGHEEYEVEAILRHKGKGPWCLYQVLWKGFPITEASWEPKLRTSLMLLKSWRSTCTASPPRTSHGGAGSEEAAQPIDGVLEDSWGRT